MVALEVVVMTNHGATGDDKVGIMITLSIQFIYIDWPYQYKIFVLTV